MKPNADPSYPIPGYEKRFYISHSGRVFDVVKQEYRRGSTLPKGYRTVSLDGRVQMVSRLMGVTFLGLLPHQQMDHINGRAGDDRLGNLRVCTFAQNQQNRRRRKDNRSGHVGVYWLKDTHRWAAKIEANKVKHRLGYFRTFEEAVAAYQGAAALHHGEFRSTRR